MLGERFTSLRKHTKLDSKLCHFNPWDKLPWVIFWMKNINVIRNSRKEVIFMAMTPEKRSKMEKLIYDTFDALDPTGSNTKKYKDKFSEMSDSQFDSFFKQFFANPKEFLILDIVEYERTLSFDKIEKAAKVLDIPLFEDLYMPHITMDKNNVVCTKYPVAVGYLPIKRPQQILHKKNGLSINTEKRSALTGQVTSEDKNGRQSDAENTMMVALGADKILEEMNGPRSDDMTMKSQMNVQIANNGYVHLSDLNSDPANKTTLNTVNVYLIGMGLKTDLVTPGLMFKNTIREEM